MRILIAEDDPINRRILEASFDKWGYEAIITENGKDAVHWLNQKDGPRLALLDWMMPEMDGVEVCKSVRKNVNESYIYIILLTAKARIEDITTGLSAGADDYLTKPFKPAELKARLEVGFRILDLQDSLKKHIKDLEDALSQVKQLQGLLPICSYCKKIRNDQNYWQQVDYYITEHTEVKFSHGICPECLEKVIQDESYTEPL